MAIGPTRLSPSVESAASRFSPSDEVSAWDFVRALLAIHPEYGGGLASRIVSAAGPEGSERRPIDAWTYALREHLPDNIPVIHGRLAILSLAELDPRLADFLASTGFLDQLRAETTDEAGNTYQDRGVAGTSGTASTPEPTIPNVPRRKGADPFDEEISQDLAVQDVQPADTDVAASEPRVVVTSGYTTDSVSGRLVDRLGVVHEVQVIAHLLASRAVKPPLSLGLFGDWGTGKSYFMSMLRAYIDDIAAHFREEERRTGRPSEWCTRVLQIEFNAWHYADANLWASLVTRIYAALQAELKPGTPDDDLKERLEAEVREAEGITRAAEAQIRQAEQWVEKASGELRETESDVARKADRLDGLIGDVRNLLGSDERLAARLDEAARDLGVPRAAEAWDALQSLRANLASLSGRLAAIGISALRSKGTIPLLAGLVVVAPAAVGWVTSLPAFDLEVVGRRVVEVSTAILGLIAWVQRQLARGVRHVDTVEAAVERASAERQRRMDSDAAVLRAAQELTLAEAAQRAAWQNLENSRAELTRLRTELSELGLERRIFQLLEERGRSATYTRHLGIVSLIREDFEKISGLFARLDREDRDLTREPPPIQRIILYIDDLDRCQADRVVQVLEAVHMLLAFPLFTVVVGVDPGWLRESLLRVHSRTLQSGGATPPDGSPLAESTPQDYLEKIFQIPFALQRVDEAGYRNLVGDLLRPQPFTTPAPPIVARETLTGEPAVPADDGGEAEPIHVDSLAPGIRPAPGRSAAIAFTPMRARQLEFTEVERRDIDTLWPLFATPRSVKRFINTYRLLRASVPDGEIADFEGTGDAPGEYQVALLPLALASACPNEFGAFKDALLAWATTPEAPRVEGGWTWFEVLDRLRAPLVAVEPGWSALDSVLREIVRSGFGRRFTQGQAARWALRAARFTFSTLPARAPVTARVGSRTVPEAGREREMEMEIRPVH